MCRDFLRNAELVHISDNEVNEKLIIISRGITTKAIKFIKKQRAPIMNSKIGEKVEKNPQWSCSGLEITGNCQSITIQIEKNCQ